MVQDPQNFPLYGNTLLLHQRQISFGRRAKSTICDVVCHCSLFKINRLQVFTKSYLLSYQSGLILQRSSNPSDQRELMSERNQRNWGSVQPVYFVFCGRINTQTALKGGNGRALLALWQALVYSHSLIKF